MNPAAQVTKARICETVNDEAATIRASEGPGTVRSRGGVFLPAQGVAAHIVNSTSGTPIQADRGL